jgi:hypothetical protein
MKILMRIIAVFMLLFSAACVEPEKRPYYDDRIDIPDRLENQQRRIDQGIASGALIRAEADVVQDNLNWIRQEYSKAKADGRVSREEWEHIERHLDLNSRMIYDKKQNPVRRLYPPVYQAPQPVDISERIADQQKRIDSGIASGELTRAEADIVQDNLNWIRAELRRLRSDGLLTERELQRLDEMLDRNNMMIYNKKHNPVRRLY